MAEPISIQQLKNASLDVKSLEEVVNGDENVVVTTRLGETYPSVKGSISKIFENGGLPATPFKTKALMTASALVDGDYAFVSDDPTSVNNGIYYKESGAFKKSNFDFDTMTEASISKRIIKLSSIVDFADAVNVRGASAGDYYYHQVNRTLNKLVSRWGGETLAAETIPLTEGTLYVYNRIIYVYKPEFGLVEYGLGDKIETLYSYGLMADALKNGADVGDFYANFSVNKVYLIEKNIDGEYYGILYNRLSDNKLFKYGNSLYRLQGGVLKYFTDSEGGKKVQVLYSFMAGLREAIARGAGLGDLYLNINGSIFVVTGLDGEGYGSAKQMPFEENTLYLYSGRLYSYVDGLGLTEINTDNWSKSVDPKMVQPTADSVVHTYANGLKFADELEENKVKLSKTGDRFAHTPTMLIKNDVVYSTYMVNYTSAAENTSQISIRFHYFPIDNPANDTYLDLCSIGDIKMGRKVVKNYDSVIFEKDGVIHILWNAELEGDGFYTTLYQTFNIATASFSEVSVAQFKVGDITKPLTKTGINEAFIESDIVLPELDLHIVIMNHVSTRVEGGITYYYTGIGSRSNFNIIVKTKDFFTWEYVSHPPFPNKGQYEPTVRVVGNTAYYYCRQVYAEDGGFFAKYNILTDKWTKEVVFDEVQSRSQFFMGGNTLYLIYSPTDRRHTGIIEINRTYPSQSKVVQVAHTAGVYSYHGVVPYNGSFYTIFSDNKITMNFSKFSIGSVGKSDIDNKFRQLLLV